MAGRTERDFSKRTLVVAEQTQKLAKYGRRLGDFAVQAVTGSSSPAYVQLDWQSRGVHSIVKNTVRVAGDPNAGRLARNWNSAVVMAVKEEELEQLGADYASPGDYQTAVAYLSEGVVHVGTHPDKSETVLRRLDDRHLGVAMRLGRSSLEAACGLWVPEDNTFIGAESVGVVVPHMHIDYLPRTMQGIALV